MFKREFTPTTVSHSNCNCNLRKWWHLSSILQFNSSTVLLLQFNVWKNKNIQILFKFIFFCFRIKTIFGNLQFVYSQLSIYDNSQFTIDNCFDNSQLLYNQFKAVLHYILFNCNKFKEFKLRNPAPLLLWALFWAPFKAFWVRDFLLNRLRPFSFFPFFWSRFRSLSSLMASGQTFYKYALFW